MTNCVECGGQVEKRSNQLYRFLESGLRNVWLKGITVYHCKECGATVPEIPSIDRFHTAIADAIVEKKFALVGPEFRFLRKQMRMKAKDLAAFLGVTLTTVSRWETGAKSIGPANDRLMRAFYMFWRLKQGDVIEPGRLFASARSTFSALNPAPRNQRIELPISAQESVLCEA
jgi:putative zinc finger/helix-turn-helix YgiT family protein